jgi:MtN3 and saliva related transmembrane protein
MEIVQAAGYIAGAVTTISFIPQAIKVYKTKMVRDISLPSFLIFMLGLGFWILYGAGIGSIPIVLFNTIMEFIALYIVIAKIIYGKKANGADNPEAVS